jgi:hypothetical protein
MDRIRIIEEQIEKMEKVQAVAMKSNDYAAVITASSMIKELLAMGI